MHDKEVRRHREDYIYPPRCGGVEVQEGFIATTGRSRVSTIGERSSARERRSVRKRSFRIRYSFSTGKGSCTTSREGESARERIITRERKRISSMLSRFRTMMMRYTRMGRRTTTTHRDSGRMRWCCSRRRICRCGSISTTAMLMSSTSHGSARVSRRTRKTSVLLTPP